MYDTVWVIVLRGKLFCISSMAFFMGSYKFYGCCVCVVLKNLAMENNQFSSVVRDHYTYKEVWEQYRFCV